jgi:hypothetical protein
MALFSLAEGIKIKRDTPYGVLQAFQLSKLMLDDYRRQGLTVTFHEEVEGQSFAASIANREGTTLRAELRLNASAYGCLLDLVLTGTVAVGGVQGMFATDTKVRKVAKDRLQALLDRIFDPTRVPVEGAPTADDESVEEAAIDHEGPDEPILDQARETEAISNGALIEGPEEELEDPQSGVPRQANEGSKKEVVGDIQESLRSEAVQEAEKSNKLLSVGVSERTLEQRLLLLKKMRDHELINEEDFKTKKNEILASI